MRENAAPTFDRFIAESGRRDGFGWSADQMPDWWKYHRWAATQGSRSHHPSTIGSSAFNLIKSVTAKLLAIQGWNRVG